MNARWGLGLVGVTLLSFSAGAAAPAVPPAPRERRLHLASAEASSYLVNDWNKFQENYLPLYVGDDDPKTAWTLKTEGIGEWLRVHFTSLAGATKVRLKIRNGYQKSDKLWAANSRAHGLTIVLLPSKKTVDVELEDKSGWQELAVEQPAGPLEAVELRVRSVYAGKKYDDLCLSDVQAFVTATAPDNPAFEKQRLEKIVTWKKERLEAAKMFATKLGQALPIAAQYLERADEGSKPQQGKSCRGDVACWLAEGVATARVDKADGSAASSRAFAAGLARDRFATMTPVKISTLDKRLLPAVDGTCAPQLSACSDGCGDEMPLPRALGYLDAQTLVTTEHNVLPTIGEVVELKPPQCHRDQPTTFAWVSRAAPTDGGAPGPVRALLLALCGMVEGREGASPDSQFELLVYGASGRLDLMVTSNNAATYRWEGEGSNAKLARALVTSAFSGHSFVVEAATAVAGR